MSPLKFGRRLLPALLIVTGLVFLYQNCGESFKTVESSIESTGGASGGNSNESLSVEVLPGAPLVTTNTSYSVTFSVTTGGGARLSSVQCQLDGGTAQDCSGGVVSYVNLVDGDHSVMIIAQIESGLRVEKTQTFRSDATAPVLTVTQTPPAVTAATSAQFVFSATDALSGIKSYSCDSGSGFSACSSPLNLSGLTAGSTTVRIQAVDGAGNISSTYSYTWTINTAAPSVTLSSNVGAFTKLTQATFTFSGTNATSFQCSLDGGAAATCVSPHTVTVAANAAHALQVTPFSSSGVAGAASSVQWTVDTVAPSAPSLMANIPVSTTSKSATFNFSSTDTLSGVASFQCALNGAAAQTCVSPHAITVAAAGSYSMMVQALDKAGNISSGSSFAWTVTDPTTPPPPSSGGAPTVTPIAGGTMDVAPTFPNPTVHNISVEWAPSQMTASEAKVQFRKVGSSDWYQGMPLRLVQAGSGSGFSWKKRYTGSIFDVEANTSYEVVAYQTDSSGNVTLRTPANAVVKTRAVPAAMAGAPIKNATPATLASVLSSAVAGDIVLLGAGSYSTFTVSKSGTDGKPIVIRGQAGVTVTGTINVRNVKYVNIENITTNNAGIRIDNSQFLGIIGNTVNSGAAMGIGSGGGGQMEVDTYIADNVVTGAAPWDEAKLGVDSGVSYEGIQLSGPGHVVMNNKVSGYRDCLSMYESDEAVNQWSVDFIGNDLSICVDDAIEADYCFHNCRVMRNRITNAFMGITSQPTLGGPNYIVRNVMYSILFEPFKLHNGTDGDVILNNTTVKVGDVFAVYDSGVSIENADIRNNLMIGSIPGASYSAGYSNGSGKVLSLPTFDRTTGKMDYQAYGVAGATTFSGNLGGLNFTSLATMNSGLGGLESKSIQVGLDVFASPVVSPLTPKMNRWTPPDLRVSPSSAVVGKAVRIPNINDFAPSGKETIGAYEAGAVLPVYGPRK